jgi:hypothetical protein
MPYAIMIAAFGEGPSLPIAQVPDLDQETALSGRAWAFC